MLLQILNLVIRLIGIVTGIDSLVKIIEGDVTSSAQETTKFLIQTNTNTAVNDLSDPTFGLAKLASNQAAILLAIASARADILAAIAACQQGGSPVTLPPSQPPAYNSSTAQAVWGQIIDFGTFGNNSAAACLTETFIHAKNEALRAPMRWFDAEHFYLLARSDSLDLSPLVGTEPQPALANVRPTDTVLSWLQREWPALTWFVGPDGSVQANDNTLFFTSVWVSIYTDHTLQLAARGAVAAVGTLNEGPPVWPGLANVVLGTALSLSNGLTIPGPLDGVIVHITAVPNPIGFYPFGAIKSFVKVGGIIFVDDNGNAEQALPLGLETNVICPKAQVRADHAILRLQSGVVGTIQPWTHI